MLAMTKVRGIRWAWLVIGSCFIPSAAPAVAPLKSFTSGQPISAADTNANFKILGDAIAAMEQPVAALSAPLKQFQTSSVTAVPVSDLTVSISTQAGECVKFELFTIACVNPSDESTFAFEGSTHAKGQVAVFRDATTVVGRAFTQLQLGANLGFAGSLAFLDQPPAGAHTYTVEVATQNAGGLVKLNCVRAMATRIRCQ